MAERDEELWMAQQEARFWREEARRIWTRAQALKEYLEERLDDAPYELVEALELEPPGADLNGEVFREAVRRRVFQVLNELGMEV